MAQVGFSWFILLMTASIQAVFFLLRDQTAASLYSLLSRHSVLIWIMTVLTMDNMKNKWQVNNNLTDLTYGRHNLYLVQNTPSFWDKTQAPLLISVLISISSVIIFSSLGYRTNNEGAVNDLSSLGHHCLCMPLSLGPSVKAPPRADCYLSLWSPYLLTVSLLLMIVKPLFSLKRVCPVPVRREQ